MFSNFAFLDLDTPDMIIILAIILLLFGGKKLPQLSRSLGQSMRELRKGLSGDIKEEDKHAQADQPPNQDKDVAA